MKKDNRGLSLVELIIVMAIIAVIAGAASIGVGLITGRPADKCASRLQTVMQNNRITTMGKLDASMRIYMDAAGCIYVDELIKVNESTTNTVTTQVGAAGVVLQYKITGEDAYRELTPGTVLLLSFDRSSGAFKDLTAMGLPGHYCEEIKIVKGNRTKILRLSYLTGKISLE